LEALSALANIAQIAGTVLAFYLYIRNRDKISNALRLLLNFSFQTTLTELKEKLERLNEYNANEPDDLPEIRSILHEICGQIRGNERLAKAIPHLAAKFEGLAESKRLGEPAKRSIVSELREQLKNIQVNSIETDTGQNP
jgi:hypothetical protein